jgi:hypothetical protein
MTMTTCERKGRTQGQGPVGARGNEVWGGTTMRRERKERLAVGLTARREERTNRAEGVRRAMSGGRSGQEEEEQKRDLRASSGCRQGQTEERRTTRRQGRRSSGGSETRLTVSCGCGQRAEDGCERTSVARKDGAGTLKCEAVMGRTRRRGHRWSGRSERWLRASSGCRQGRTEERRTTPNSSQRETKSEKRRPKKFFPPPGRSRKKFLHRRAGVLLKTYSICCPLSVARHPALDCIIG